MSVKKRKAPAIGTSANPVLDVKRSLLRAFAINERANQKLLEGISDAAWQTPPPGGNGRTIAGISSHIHNVRLMWLGKESRAVVMESLRARAKLVSKLPEMGLEEPAGRVPNFKPDVVAFAGYLIAHDSHHRGQITMLAHQIGMPAPSKTSFGLWEWGTLWKECGTIR